jgi:hypothetical protein
MGWACAYFGGDEKYVQNFGGELPWGCEMSSIECNTKITRISLDEMKEVGQIYILIMISIPSRDITHYYRAKHLMPRTYI